MNWDKLDWTGQNEFFYQTVWDRMKVNWIEADWFKFIQTGSDRMIVNGTESHWFKWTELYRQNPFNQTELTDWNLLNWTVAVRMEVNKISESVWFNL